MWQETPEGPGRNDDLRLDDDFGDRNPERNDILQLDGGMRESEIVNTYRQWEYFIRVRYRLLSLYNPVLQVSSK